MCSNYASITLIHTECYWWFQVGYFMLTFRHNLFASKKKSCCQKRILLHTVILLNNISLNRVKLSTPYHGPHPQLSILAEFPPRIEILAFETTIPLTNCRKSTVAPRSGHRTPSLCHNSFPTAQFKLVATIRFALNSPSYDLY